MFKSPKARHIVALSAGAAVGLSATAIVLLEGPSISSEHAKIIQSALRDGASAGKVSPDTSAWFKIAQQSNAPTKPRD